MQEKRLINYIAAHRNRLIGLTRDLIKIPTVNPPGENYKEMVSLLLKKCKRLHLKTRKIEPPKSLLKALKIKGSRRINLLAEWDAGAKETIHINGHYDVVPPTRNWKTPPFKPTVKAGRLYGRGAEDMKGNIAAVLFALEAVTACGLKPAYNIQLSFTPDEETGGKAGFGYLVRSGYIKADFGIGEGYHNNFASYGNKGMLWFNVEVLGRSCHACEPYNGVNSFEKMLVVAGELIKLKEKIERRTTKYGTKNPRDKHPTMVLGGELWGGRKTNIVPDISTFTIDRRLIPEENIKDAKAEVFEVIKRLKKKDRGLKVRVEVTSEENPVISKKGDIFFRLFSDAIRKVRKKPAKFAILSGGTDMRFLIRKGVPSVGYSVDGGNTCHSDNEYVKIRDLVDTAKIFALFLSGSA